MGKDGFICGFYKILLEFFVKVVYLRGVLAVVPVAQLDRVSASDAEGRGFESLRVRHKQTAFSCGRLFVYAA